MLLLEELSSLERLALIDMSYSRIDTYTTCPSKYFYSYIAQEDRVFGPAAALGNIVHSVLEQHVGESLDVPEMYQTFEYYREVFDPNRLIGEDLISVGFSLITEFVDRHDGETVQVLHKEMPFAFVIGSALVSGYIDRVDRTSRGIHLIDYKTGKWEVAANAIGDNLQLGIYALAVSKEYPNTDIQAELYYLRSGRRKSCFFGVEELKQVEERVVATVQQMIEDRSFHPTENVRACSYCDYRQTKVCPVGVSRYRDR